MGDDERGIRYHNNLANTQHEDGADFAPGKGISLNIDLTWILNNPD